MFAGIVKLAGMIHWSSGVSKPPVFVGLSPLMAVLCFQAALSLSACDSKVQEGNPDLAELTEALVSLDPAGCCYESDSPGCSDSTCSFCVCKEDPYCCDTIWDSHCVARASKGCLSDCGCESGCSSPPGDINQSLATNILDVQCVLLSILADLSGDAEPPACILGDLYDADVNCDGSLNVSDTQMLTIMALDLPLVTTIDANEDGCPDACEYIIPPACENLEDGTFCDDGNRCTEGDACLEGVCVGGAPPDCDDGNICTTDLCNINLGCRSFANSNPCAVETGTGTCVDKMCIIDSCAPNTWDLNAIGDDGCEYTCAPVPSLTEVCINNKDDDCNGAVDEGCLADCDGVEIPDNGVDEDCDGTELVHVTNELSYIGKLPIETNSIFTVGLAGTFDFGPFGSIGSDGDMERLVVAGPVTWCTTGSKPEQDFGSVLLSDIVTTVCKNLSGTVIPTYSATLEWEGELRSASGAFGYDGDGKVFVDMSAISLSPSIILDEVSLEVLPNGQPALLTATVTIGTGTSAFQGVVTGSYTGTGDLTLGLVQASNSPWTPLDALALTVEDASGVLSRTEGEWNATIVADATALSLAPSLNLSAVSIEAEAPTGDGHWTLTLNGNATVGPFENVVLVGDVYSTSTESLQGCLSGTGTQTINGIPMSDVLLEPCVTATTTVSTSVAGDMLIEGLSAPFTGFLSMASPWYLTATLPHLPLAAGITIDSALLIFQENSTKTPLLGEITLGAGVTAVTFVSDGDYEPVGDFSLDLSLPVGVDWLPIPGLPMLVTNVQGSIDRSSGTTSLLASSTETIPSDVIDISASFTVNDPFVQATVTPEGDAKITLEGSAFLGPFDTVNVSGTADEDGTFCFESNTGLSNPLAVLTNTALETCIDPQGNVTNEFTTDAAVAGTDIQCTGSASLDSPWVVELDVPEWDLSPDFTLFDVALILVEDASKLKINGGFDVTSEGSTVEVRASGFYSSDGPLNLPLSLAEDSNWKPFASLDFVVTDIIGNLKKTDDEVTFSFTSTNSIDVDLGGGLFMTGAVVLVESLPDGEVKVTLLGDVDLGPLGEAELEGVPTTNDEGETIGCFSQTTALALGSIIIQNAELKVCLAGGLTSSTTFEGEGVIDGDLRPLSGELGEDLLTATIDLGTHLLGPGVLMENVVLTYVETSPFFQLVGTSTLGNDTTGITVNLSGLYKNHGNAYLTPSISPATPWAPLEGLDLSYSSVSGLVDRISDVTEAEVIGTGGGTVTVGTGFQLANTQAQGTVLNGNWEVAIMGDTELPVGEDTLEAFVKAEDVHGSDILLFIGDETGALDPLPSFVGADHFLLIDPEVTLTGELGDTPSISLAAGVKLCMSTAPCTLSAMSDSSVEGPVSIGGDFFFEGTSGNVSIPGFGGIAGANVFASTTPQDTQEVLAGVSRPIQAGVSVAGETESPYPLTADEDEVPFFLEFTTPSTILVEGVHYDDWSAVGPGVIPAVDGVTIEAPRLDGTLKGTALKLHLFGKSVLQPANQAEPLVSDENIKYTIQGNALYTNKKHFGVWRGAAFWASLGLEDPTMYIRFQKSGGVPLIHRITTKNGGYWLRPGETWPAAGESIKNAPGVTAVSSQHALWRQTILSWLCGLGPCVKIQEYRTRVVAPSLTLEEMVALINDGRDAAITAGYGAFLSDAPLTVPDLAPLDMQIESGVVEFASRGTNGEGVKWSPGLYADLTTSTSGALGQLHGRMDSAGLMLTGTTEGVLVSDTQLLQTPDQYYLDVSDGGSANWDDEDALDLGDLTMEGWVYQDTWTTGTLAHVLTEKFDGSNGIRFGVGDPIGAKARLRIELYSNGSKRTVSSSHRLIESGEWNHIAVSTLGSKVALFLNGKRLLIKATGPNKAAINPIGTPFVLGNGWDGVDNIRLWAEGQEESDISGRRHFEEGTPVASFEFDTFQSGSSIANGGTGLDATLEGVAQVAPLPSVFGENEWQLLLGENTSAEPLLLRAGVDWMLPVPEAQVSSLTESTLGSGTTTGTSRIGQPVLLEMTNLGDLGLTGPGDDNVIGTADDTLSLSADILHQTLDGEGRWTFSGPSGQAEQGGEEASVLYECPTSDGCPLPPYGHVLQVDGELELESTLPNDLGTFGLEGLASFDSGSSTLHTSGSITVFDQTIASPSILSDTDETNLIGAMDLSPTVGFAFTSVEIPLLFDHDALTLCGEGEGDSEVVGLDGTLDAEVEACVGSETSLDYTGTGSIVTLLGRKLYSPVLFGDSSGLTLAGQAYLPGIFTGYLVGPYAGPTDFSLSATTTLTLKGFKLYGANIFYTPGGMSASGNLVAGLAGVFALSGPIVGNDPILSGDGEMEIDGAAWMATLTTTSSLDISGTVDISPLNIDVEGTLATPGNLVVEGAGPVTFITGGGGWYFPEVEVAMSSCVKATGLCAGVSTPYELAKAEFPITIPGSSAQMTGPLGVSPLVFLDEGHDGIFGTHSLLNPLWTFDEDEGLVIQGDVSMPTGPVPVSGVVPPVGAYTLSAEDETTLLNNPPMSGLVSLQVDLLGNSSVGGPLTLVFEGEALQDATWTKGEDEAFTFEGVKVASGDFGERCAPDPSTKTCETCTETVCDFECSSPFGTYCCASHIETYECNCVTEDYCDDLGEAVCNVVVNGTEAGYSDTFDAICSVDGGAPFQTAVPRTTGNMCIYGGSVLETQCVQLW